MRDFSAKFVEVSQKLGIATSPKHFPGDGVDERDQHLVTSINALSCEDWDNSYGEVYKACIDAGALTIMIGHIMQPAYSKRYNPALRDEDIMPTTLSPELLQKLLRQQLGFNGMIISDATSMAGMAIPMPRHKAVPYSIACGCDMFLFSKNLDEDIAFMHQGYKDGVITPQRLDDAVTRILATKAALGLHTKQRQGTLAPTLENLERVMAEPKYQEWARECADKAVTLVKEEPGVLPLDPGKTPRILIYGLEPSGEGFFSQSAIDDTPAKKLAALLGAKGFETTIWQPAKGFEGLMSKISDVTDNYDVIVYIANLSTKSNPTVVRLEWAQPMGVNVPTFISQLPTIFISTENPYHLIGVPQVKTFINAYSTTDHTLSAIVDKLMGNSPFLGQSPVDAFCGMWDTRL